MGAPFDLPEAAEAQAIHKRRALVRAAEHGAALLDALDLSPLALDALDEAIAALDAVDGDVDLEDGCDAEHDTADMEDDGTSEPMLGAPERHPSAPFFSHFFRSDDGRQFLWGQGRNDGCNDGEAEPGYDLACDDDEFDDDGLARGEGCESDGGEPYLSVVEFDGLHDNWWRSGRQTHPGFFTDLEVCAPVDMQAAAARPVGASALPSAGDLAMRAKAQKRGNPSPADGLARPWIGAPDVFGLRVQGDCCAPYILDGGAVHVDQRAEPEVGDFVAIFFEVERAGQRVMQGWVKRLSMGLPRGMRWPFNPAPTNELEPVLVVESLNPARCYSLDIRRVHAVFKVVDILPPAAAIAARERMARDGRQ